MLMCSPFMNPEISNKKNGLCFVANNTQNALFERIDGVFGVPFVIDDITTNPQINLNQVIYTLADGTSKGRLNGDGTLRTSGYGWSGVAITSSETCILDYGDQYQGLKARVIHTQGIQWTKNADEADLVKNTVRQNFGFTGKEFALFVASKGMQDLCQMYDKAKVAVKSLMVKKDNLTDRLASKYAAVYITVELLNEAFGYGLSADGLLTRLILCEQESFEERDNAAKAFKHMLDFITRNRSHFLVERRFSNRYLNFEDMNRPIEIYGKIFMYDDLWEVHVLRSLTKKELGNQGLGGEIRGIRKKWIDRKLARGDSDHQSRQYCYTKSRERYDCLLIQGGIAEPESEEILVEQVEESQETPVSDYTVDDDAIIAEIFGGQNDD